MSIDAFANVLRIQTAKCYKLPLMSLEAEITVGSYKFKAMAVSSMSTIQNYHDNLFEDGMITVAMSVRQYTEVVLYGHEDIRISVIKRPISGGGKPITSMYRGIITEYIDKKAEGNNAELAANAGTENFSIVNFQLLPVAAYNLRLHEVGGTFYDTTTSNVLKYFLKRLQLSDEFNTKESVSRINFDLGASERKFGTISIREGTPLLGLVDYLQDVYGIYQQGIGCYLQNGRWYIFEPYGTSKKNLDVARLKIFNAPMNRSAGSTQTMYLDGKTVNIISTGNVSVSKNSDVEALNGGTGTRYGDLRAIAGKATSTDPNVDPIMKPEEYISEYRASSYAGPYQRTVTAEERFTDNPLKHASNLARRSGRIVKVTWENAMMEMLIPGMPVCFHYGKDNKVVVEHGTLLGAMGMSQILNGGIIEKNHITTVELTLFLKA